jgi:hypothetical protein
MACRFKTARAWEAISATPGKMVRRITQVAAFNENWQPNDCQFFISFPLSTAFSSLFRQPHVCCRVKHYQDALTITTKILYK